MRIEELSLLLQLIITEAYMAGWDERSKKDPPNFNHYDGGEFAAQIYARDRLRQFS